MSWAVLIGRGLDLVKRFSFSLFFFIQFSSCIFAAQLVLMARRIHPFPSRTRKLSYAALKILGGKLPGKIGRCQHKKDHPKGWSFLLHCNCFGPWSIKAKRQLDGQSEEMSGRRGRFPVRGRPAGPTDFIGPFSHPPVPSLGRRGFFVPANRRNWCLRGRKSGFEVGRNSGFDRCGAGGAAGICPKSR